MNMPPDACWQNGSNGTSPVQAAVRTAGSRRWTPASAPPTPVPKPTLVGPGGGGSPSPVARTNIDTHGIARRVDCRTGRSGRAAGQVLAHPDACSPAGGRAMHSATGRLSSTNVTPVLPTPPFVLAAGDVVRLWMDWPGSARKVSQRAARSGELSVVYEDESLMVINKPAGLLTVPLPRQEEAPSVEQSALLPASEGEAPAAGRPSDRP